MRVVARFLGFISFGPTKTLPEDIGILEQLSEEDQEIWLYTPCPKLKSIQKELTGAFQQRTLVMTVPWVVEYLRMAKQDIITMKSQAMTEVLELLRFIYFWITSHPNSFFPPTLGLLVTSIEEVFPSLMTTQQDRSDCVVHLVDPTPATKPVTDSMPLRLCHRIILGPRSSINGLFVIARNLESTTEGKAQTIPLPEQSPVRAGEATTRNMAMSSVSNKVAVLAALQHQFFHNLPDLREVCDFVLSRATRNSAQFIKTAGFVQQLKPILQKHITVDEASSVPLEARDQVMRDLSAKQKAQITGAILNLAPPNCGEQVLEVATELSIEAAEAKLVQLVGFALEREVHDFRENLCKQAEKATKAAEREQNMKEGK